MTIAGLALVIIPLLYAAERDLSPRVAIVCSICWITAAGLLLASARNRDDAA
jgi:hypothetical protein